jgi:hypothetical protein
MGVTLKDRFNGHRARSLLPLDGRHCGRLQRYDGLDATRL